MHLLNALLPVARRLRGSRPRDAVASARFSNTAARVPLLWGRSYTVAATHVAFLNMQGGDAGKTARWHVSIWPSLVCLRWSSSLYLRARCFTVLEDMKQQKPKTLGAAF